MENVNMGCLFMQIKNIVQELNLYKEVCVDMCYIGIID